eukprot:365280-Chlamydomonas_euryale.AAC.6
MAHTTCACAPIPAGQAGHREPRAQGDGQQQCHRAGTVAHPGHAARVGGKAPQVDAALLVAADDGQAARQDSQERVAGWSTAGGENVTWKRLNCLPGIPLPDMPPLAIAGVLYPQDVADGIGALAHTFATSASLGGNGAGSAAGGGGGRIASAANLASLAFLGPPSSDYPMDPEKVWKRWAPSTLSPNLNPRTLFPPPTPYTLPL